MLKIFGSWWPWGRQETLDHQLPKLIISTTTTAVPTILTSTSSSVTSSLSSSVIVLSSASNNTFHLNHSHPHQQRSTLTSTVLGAITTTLSTAFSTIIDFDAFNISSPTQVYENGSGTNDKPLSVTSDLYDNLSSTSYLLNGFGNFSILQSTSTSVLFGNDSNSNELFYINPGDSMDYSILTDPGGLSGGVDIDLMNITTSLQDLQDYFDMNISLTVGENVSTLYAFNGTDQYEFETTWDLMIMICTATILGIVILATVIGNVFVIAAILLERNLQSVANYLILSLAVADLLVACLVMPLGAVYEVSTKWKLGPELCDMWTASDVLCCTASILHLVAIALDRYWAVTNIDYVHQRTAGRIGIMILVVWALSFFVAIAPIFGWKDPEWDNRITLELQCIVSQDIGYQIFATASSFYVPLLVILVLYWRIFQTARKRIRRRQQAAQTHPEPLANSSCMALTAVGFRWKVTAGGAMGSANNQPGIKPTGLIASAAGGSGGIAAAVVTIIGRPLPTISETTTAFTNISSTNTSPEKVSYGNGMERSTIMGGGYGPPSTIDNDPPTADISVTYPSQVTPSMKPSTGRKKASNSADSKRERKAAKTLAIITGAFVCCWLPFFIIAILSSTCQPSCEISKLIMSLSLWLGYFNSTLNPIIYTIFSPEFRHAFKRILCGRRNSIRRRTRHLGVMRR